MNDFELAAQNVHNRFDLVLIASERMRELHRERKIRAENGGPWNLGKATPAQQTFTDIEEGKVGREYLLKVRDRAQPRRKPRFEDIR